MKLTKAQTNELEQLILTLSDLNGVSGAETEVSDFIKNYFKGTSFEISYDNLGSIIVRKPSKNPNAKRVMLACHIDEVGFRVSGINKEGFLSFQNFGRAWEHILLGQSVNVHADKKMYRGIIGSKPPHLLTLKEEQQIIPLDKLFIDLGVNSKAEVNKLGIREGNIITFSSKAFKMKGSDTIAGKALDNRVSVAIGMLLMKILEPKELDYDLYFAGTVQEEVGLRGAATSAYKINPDIGLVLDVTVCNEINPTSTCASKMGNGVGIALFNRVSIADAKLFQQFQDLAKINDIPYTVDFIKNGGTDAGEILLSREGAKAITLSVPTRYFHSQTALLSLEDAVQTLLLTQAFLEQTK